MTAGAGLAPHAVVLCRRPEHLQLGQRPAGEEGLHALHLLLQLGLVGLREDARYVWQLWPCARAAPGQQPWSCTASKCRWSSLSQQRCCSALEQLMVPGLGDHHLQPS